MTPFDHLLQALCHESETLTEAQSILRLAKKKTEPGSGHELGSHTTGLPAICAHIASQRLNNGDVSWKTAQAASCLKASDFEKVFHIVQAAIGGSKGRPGASEIYESLVQKYTPPIDRVTLFSWLRATERALVQSDSRVSLEDLNLKSAVFFWVCNVITSKNVTTVEAFAEDNDIPHKSFTRLVGKIGSTCSSLKARIRDENQSPSKTTTTPRKSPTKTPLRVLPSRDSPQKRKLTSTTTLDPVESDIDLLPETPVKRRKAESPSKTTHHTSPTKPIFPPTPSSSRVTLDTSNTPKMTAVSTPQPPRRSQRTKSTQPTSVIDLPMDVDAPPSPLFSDPDESDDSEPPPPRRFRPVYLDHKQWFTRDSRLNYIWKQAEKHKQNMSKLYGHPLAQFQSLTVDP